MLGTSAFLVDSVKSSVIGMSDFRLHAGFGLSVQGLEPAALQLTGSFLVPSRGMVAANVSPFRFFPPAPPCIKIY